MVLVDTSIWIDHLHRAEVQLVELLNESRVAQHPMIVGELALGTLGDRKELLGLLAALPTANVASHAEVLHFVERNRLYGRGLSLVDAHLLASVLLTPGTRLWTRDKRLFSAAESFGVGYSAELSGD